MSADAGYGNSYDFEPGDGIDTIDGGADHDTLYISGTSVYEDWQGKGYGGNSYLNVVVVDGAITSIEGGEVTNVESVILDLSAGEWLIGGGGETGWTTPGATEAAP